jgi:hypothetical protein
MEEGASASVMIESEWCWPGSVATFYVSSLAAVACFLWFLLAQRVVDRQW